MCGGTDLSLTLQIAATGLSPRVRGNRDEQSRTSFNQRSIPACAGEPSGRLPAFRCRPVYPRVCGGTGPARSPCPWAGGLSPRVRGNRAGGQGFDVNGGSIPACAGEPWSTYTMPGSRRVYPRVCGGTYPSWSCATARVGLSPRVRGNPERGHRHGQEKRSIPACAGEPSTAIGPPSSCGVYPRVCGGTGIRANINGVARGLSPRVRGNR